jgi:nucleotide-binding universal stress UspA family protein
MQTNNTFRYPIPVNPDQLDQREPKEKAMPTKIIVSYDGTANEDDAVALGRIFHSAGAEVALAYVRHTVEPDHTAEAQAQSQAEALLERAAGLLGNPGAARHVVTDRSTPEGLRKLAEAQGADVIAFCSDSHTAKGHVAVGNSAQRLLEGGSTAVAIAPAGLADGAAEASVQQVVAVGDANGGAQATAEGLAQVLGATVAPVANQDADLLVIDSRPAAQQGRVSVSSSASHLIELATCPVLVVPRGVTLHFGRVTAGAVA